MGRRGPKRTPTKILEMRDSPVAKARAKKEPKPAASSTGAPAWLPKRARELWDVYTPRLQALGLLSAVDEPAWAACCETWGRYLDAVEILKKHGQFYKVKTREGATTWRKHPAVEVAKGLLPELQRIWASFGMTPAARSGMDVAPPAPSVPTATTSEEEDARFLGRRTA